MQTWTTFGFTSPMTIRQQPILFLTRYMDVFTSLGEQPGIGHDRSDLRPKLRVISASRHYLVFFRPGKAALRSSVFCMERVTCRNSSSSRQIGRSLPSPDKARRRLSA